MDLKAELVKYLKKHKLMTLATSGDKGISACSVYYAMDDKYNLYFVSHEQSEHVANLQKNNSAAMVVMDSNQPFDAKKSGVQMKGTVYKLEQGEEHTKALELWMSSVGGYEDKRIFELSGVRAMSGLVFKIGLNSAKYLNEELFGEYIEKEIVF
jgi:uncharacterized protein YhbP (UPF0306 family)